MKFHRNTLHVPLRLRSPSNTLEVYGFILVCPSQYMDMCLIVVLMCGRVHKYQTLF